LKKKKKISLGFCFVLLFTAFKKKEKKTLYTLNAWTALKRKKIYEMAQTNKTRLKFCAEKYFKGL
jgi:hypothetical protein